jgi:hypothetical protein
MFSIMTQVGNLVTAAEDMEKQHNMSECVGEWLGSGHHGTKSCLHGVLTKQIEVDGGDGYFMKNMAIATDRIERI